MKKILSFILVCLVIGLSGCGDDEKTIKVGASTAPHALILEQCRSYIEENGYKLEIVEFTDYILPNVGVDEESLDANFFQHLTYLNNYNLENKTNLVDVLKVHYEPLGIYQGKKQTLDDINGAAIGIPNDETNEARALFLLQELNLITLDSSKQNNVTIKDITSNPYNLEIVELEAATIPNQLPSLDFGIINGNYAITANITNKLIAYEGSESLAASLYPNVLCVKKGNEETAKTKLLIDALKQENIKQYISDTYGNLVIPLV